MGRAFRPHPPPGASRSRVRDHGEPDASGDSLLHLHGHDPGEVRPGRGSSGNDRHSLRPFSGRSGYWRDRCGCADGRCDRCGGGIGDGNGTDLTAGHDAKRLQGRTHGRGHRRRRHPGADHPAQHRIDRARGSAGRVGRRALPRGPGPRADPDGSVRGLRDRRRHRASGRGTRHATGGLRHSQGRVAPPCHGLDAPASGPDSGGAGQHLRGCGHTHRGRLPWVRSAPWHSRAYTGACP